MSEPPILPYEKQPAAVREHDPRAFDVAARLIERIQAACPGTVVEHIGSTAVAGLPGKGIIDLMIVAEPPQIPEITKALLGIGFQPQSGPEPFPPTRPMLQGAVEDDGQYYRIHVHVIPTNLDDAVELRQFRDALRADPAMCAAYTARKRAIVAAGTTDSLQYTHAKAGWIEGELDRLGIRRQSADGKR
jgi:GrpB-like predicted nucleotidyltransferase (UPF0157 family)